MKIESRLEQLAKTIRTRVVVPLNKLADNLDASISISAADADAWHKACSNPQTQVAALNLGFDDWTRQQRWIAKYGSHPRVIKWLAKHQPPVGWLESPEAYAWTEMPFPPGFFHQ